MADDVEVICVKSEPKYFCKGGWTGVSVICLVGQNQRFTVCDDLSTRHHRARSGDPSFSKRAFCEDRWMPGSSGHDDKL
jgi:hypothetical protein